MSTKKTSPRRKRYKVHIKAVRDITFTVLAWDANDAKRKAADASAANLFPRDKEESTSHIINFWRYV